MLKPGDLIPKDTTITGVSILVSPGQFLPEHKWIDDGIEYSVCINNLGNIQYIATSSLQVRSPEGIRVGQPLKEVLNIQNLQMRKWLGWGYVVDLPSGWKAALFLDGHFNEREPSDKDIIDMLFK